MSLVRRWWIIYWWWIIYIIDIFKMDPAAKCCLLKCWWAHILLSTSSVHSLSQVAFVSHIHTSTHTNSTWLKQLKSSFLLFFIFFFCHTTTVVSALRFHCRLSGNSVLVCPSDLPKLQPPGSDTPQTISSWVSESVKGILSLGFYVQWWSGCFQAKFAL